MQQIEIINFKSATPTTPKKEITPMNKKIIALPDDLYSMISNLVVANPRTQSKKTGVQKPQGPKKHHSSKGHRGNTTYTPEFLAQVVDFLYTNLFTLKEICAILNHCGKTTATGKAWTPSNLSAVLDTREAWALIEPRWIQWQLENPEA